MFLARIYEASGKRLTGDQWIVASFCDMGGHGLFVCNVSWQNTLDSHLPSRRTTSMESQWHGFVLFSVRTAQSVLDLHV